MLCKAGVIFTKLRPFLVFQVCLIAALGAANASAGDTPVAGPRFDQKSKVVIDGSESKKLYHAPYSELSTTIMYSRESIVSRHSKALFILFGGTGGRSHRFGIGSTMSGIAIKAKSLSADSIAFQNPLYFMDDILNDEERLPIVDKFKSAEDQVAWMAQALEFAIKPTLDAQGEPTIPIYLFTRSSGTLLAGQLSDDYIQKKPGSEVFGKITGWIGSGVLSHTPEKIDEWMKLEFKHLSEVEHELQKKEPGALAVDEIVRRIQKDTFGPMTWASEDESLPSRFLNGRPHPKVWMFLGALDPEFSLQDQVKVLEDYSRLHPEIDITGIGTPAGHNPAGGTTYRNLYQEEIELKPMKIMGPFMERLFSEKTIPHHGLKLVGDFGLEHVVSCDRLLSQFTLTPRVLNNPLE